MNVQISSTLTAAEKSLVDHFDKISADLPGSGQAWIDDVRTRAIQSFENSGLPHRRLESWKYTDLRGILREMPAPAQNSQAPVLLEQDGVDAHTAFSSVDRHLGVFVNGFYRPELSSLEDIEGVEIIKLRENFDDLPDWVQEKLCNSKVYENNAILALNTAFAADGAALRINRGSKIDKPIHLAFVVTGKEACAINTRNLIIVEEGAEATVIETYVGPPDVAYVVNTALELCVAEDAVFNRIKVQDEGHDAVHLANLIVSLAGNSKCHDLTLSVGARTSRNEGQVDFTGENVEVTISGASMLRGKQQGDTTLCVTHGLPSSNSRQEFKTVLDDHARGIFQGCVIVKPDAQHTDGRQMTQALLLSPDAEMDAKPELEIYADDVECAHGATAGDLDEDYLFYLRARGIPEDQAKALLVAAFVAAPIEEVQDEGIREALFQLTNSWFDRRNSEA